MGVEKLTIIGYEDNDFKDPIFDSEDMYFSVMINPESISTDFSLQLVEKDFETSGKNDPGKDDMVKGVGDETISFEFILDGTGVLTNGEPVDVMKKIELFKQNTYYPYKGKDDKPWFPRVLMTYGSTELYLLLTSLKVDYTLFKSNGDPLRAKISCQFKQSMSEGMKQATQMKNAKSSEVTFPIVKTIREGDTLPLLCYDVYGDISKYYAVAKDNNMSSFQLEVGETITFKDPKQL